MHVVYRTFQNKGHTVVKPTHIYAAHSAKLKDVYADFESTSSFPATRVSLNRMSRAYLNDKKVYMGT